MSRLDEYQTRSNELQAALVRARAVQKRIFVAAALIVLLCIPGNIIYRITAVISLAVLARKYATNRSGWLRLGRLHRFYLRGVARLDGSFAGEGCSGEEFAISGHPYASDLNVLGVGSLFELVCTARTEMGRRRLAQYLLEGSGIGEARERQSAIRELSARPDLRERIALLGKFDYQETSVATFGEWLAAPPALAGPALRFPALIVSTAVVLLVVVTYVAAPLTLNSWTPVAPWIGVGLAINVAIAIAWHRRTKTVLEAARRMGLEVGLLRQGVELLNKLTFDAPKLKSILAALEDDDAGRTLRRLERMTSALHRCDHWAFELAAKLLIVRFHLIFAIERWRERHGDALRRWMNAWGEFEALAALSGYAYEHPADSYPEFLTSGTVFRADELGHPLLPEQRCVRNSITLDKDSRFLIVSGSNMAGKSTLLRSIGLNLVLAYAGAPVRARSLTLSQLSLCTSIAVVDSVLEGKSKFLAEVDRLRDMLERARGGECVLFLIDEIFAGTNSGDRRTAAEAVIRSLLDAGTVGALSTHDLALTEIAEFSPLPGRNVHMGCSEGAANPMDFDYLLKPGVTRETNALAIARMAGVIG